MKKQEIKKLSKDEVLKNIDKLKKDLFNFRFQRINSEIKDPSKIGQTKKTIARLKKNIMLTMKIINLKLEILFQ
jgi:large subunit ribosomal protein L29